MRVSILIIAAAALAASPSLAQDVNNSAAAPEATDTATAPAAEPVVTNELVLEPGEATTAVPVEPVTVEPYAEPDPVPATGGGRFPWGLLGLLGLVGLLGRGRKRADG